MNVIKYSVKSQHFSFFCGKFTLIWLHIKAQVNLIINALKISVLDFFPAIPLY